MGPNPNANWKITLAQLILIPIVIAVIVMVVIDIRRTENATKVAEAKVQIAVAVKKDAEHKRETAPPPEPITVYAPPCAAGSSEHACADRVWGKRPINGTVYKVTWYAKGPYTMKDKEHPDAAEHYVPDYTLVEFYNEGDEEIPNEEFCGNLLSRFTPGQKFKRIIEESDLSEYNGCYTIEPTVLTFGGKDHAPSK